MLLHKNEDATYTVTQSPAFGPVPAGTEWVFRPALKNSDTASIYTELDDGRYIELPFDYSQGAVWPGIDAMGLKRQAENMFSTDWSDSFVR